MRRSLLCVLVLCILYPLSAWTPANQPIRLGDFPVSYTGLPSSYLYPTYLADPFAVRTELGIKSLLYADAFPDEVGMGRRTDVAIGLRFNVFRLSPADSPSLGIEGEMGYMSPFYMNADGHDLIAFDGVYYFGVSLKPFDWVSLRAIRHHFCSHYGDEYDAGLDGNPYVDFDITLNQNMATLVRDDFVFSIALYPFELLKAAPSRLSLMLYGDYSPVLLGEDILADRETYPGTYAYFWYQMGLEAILHLSQEHNAGSVYLGTQMSAWQMNGYAPNVSGSLGYIFPRTADAGARMSLGLTYYDGQSTMNNFNFTRERYTKIVFNIDV